MPGSRRSSNQNDGRPSQFDRAPATRLAFLPFEVLLRFRIPLSAGSDIAGPFDTSTSCTTWLRRIVRGAPLVAPRTTTNADPIALKAGTDQ
jgi:hypothetical protein